MLTQIKPDVYETFQYASFDRLRDAYLSGQITEKQATVLLVRKGYDGKQARLVLKGWE